jgi:hypothetical protein
VSTQSATSSRTPTTSISAVVLIPSLFPAPLTSAPKSR